MKAKNHLNGLRKLLETVRYYMTISAKTVNPLQQDSKPFGIVRATVPKKSQYWYQTIGFRSCFAAKILSKRCLHPLKSITTVFAGKDLQNKFCGNQCRAHCKSIVTMR